MVPTLTGLKLERAARWAAIALGFSIPISTALDNVLLFVILLLWLASGSWDKRLETLRTNPVAGAALAFYLLVLAGLSWGTGPIEDGLHYARKYNDLLLIPILVTLFEDPTDRHRAFVAFAAAVALTLVLSTLLWLGVLPKWPLFTSKLGDPTIFKSRIAQGILMAFGAFLFMELARNSAARHERAVWMVVALGAALNVLIMVQGRTGYVVLAGLSVLALWGRLRWKGLMMAGVLIASGAFAAYEWSGSFRTRVELAANEAIVWDPGVPTKSSIGYRLEFYWNTWEIVRKQPLLGVGTAGFNTAYAQQVEGTGMVPTRNPHNLYLLVAVQFGLLGVVALMYLLLRAWITARHLATELDASLARGVVLVVALGGLFNSLIVDHTEGLFFSWAIGILFAGLPRVRDPSA